MPNDVPGEHPVAPDDRILPTLAELVGVAFADLTVLIAALTARGLTVATAESLTGGLLGAVLTEVPGSSAVVRGGLIVYATDLKHTLAHVDARLLADRGPVDPDVAGALADGARHRCGADIGIGLTGVAGPDPQDAVPVGTWFVAINGPGDRTARLTSDGDGDGVGLGRAAIRARAVRAALQLLADTANADATVS
ncbi:MAG TPA: nicotinamide-nucleotide amidohydrolase family protein [Nakamurella sp.]